MEQQQAVNTEEYSRRGLNSMQNSCHHTIEEFYIDSQQCTVYTNDLQHNILPKVQEIVSGASLITIYLPSSDFIIIVFVCILRVKQKLDYLC